MAKFPESRPCVECTGIMDRRHGSLPAGSGAAPVDPQRIGYAPVVAIGTYYRCLKNGSHSLIVARDRILPALPRRP